MHLPLWLNKDLVRPILKCEPLYSPLNLEYAAAFFLLGGSLKDAVNVCLRQLGDWQLAVALARVVEQSNEGPILKDILSKTVLPIAFKEGNRWLASWTFWLLHRRDLAVRILVVCSPSPAFIVGCTVERIVVDAHARHCSKLWVVNGGHRRVIV